MFVHPKNKLVVLRYQDRYLELTTTVEVGEKAEERYEGYCVTISDGLRKTQFGPEARKDFSVYRKQGSMGVIASFIGLKALRGTRMMILGST